MKNILKTIQKIISYQENHDRENFILRENKFDRQAMQSVQAGKPEGGGENSGNSDQGEAGGSPKDNRGQDWGGNDPGEKKGQKRLPKKILRANTGKESAQDTDKKKVQTRLDLNRGIIERLYPQTMMTERPDRVAAALAEGRAAIILSGSPFVLVVPVTMYSQMHTGEETYLRWQYGTFIRYIRTISFYLALLLPGSYLAVVLYHQEMIPTE